MISRKVLSKLKQYVCGLNDESETLLEIGECKHLIVSRWGATALFWTFGTDSSHKPMRHIDRSGLIKAVLQHADLAKSSAPAGSKEIKAC